MSEQSRPKRTVRPTEKMKAYLESEGKGSDKCSAIDFNSAYQKWKDHMRFSRDRLKKTMEEDELADMIETCRSLEERVAKSFSSLKESAVPDQITRQRMDSCIANTKNIIALAQTRMVEVGDEEWNDEGEQARLHSMLDVDYAKSLYSLKTSTSSQQSHHSSISERRAQAAADLAKKEAELKAANDQQFQRAELQAELNRLDTERDIIIKKAEVAALDKELDGSPTLNPNAIPFTPHSESLQAIRESLDYNRIPTCEPPVFGGDPIDFPKWKRSFEGLIGHRNIRATDKLALLEKYLVGEAAESIGGMFFRSDEQAYKDAWKVLNDRFGHPSLILAAFRSRLSAWPKINAKDYPGLQRFADYLTVLNHAMPHVDGLMILNDQEENRKLLQKLPDWLIGKWGSLVYDHDNKGIPYPDFNTFTNFLSAQARIATRPVCSLLALKDDEAHRQPHQRKARTLQTNSSKDTVAQPQSRAKICPFCASDHYLPSCGKFLEKDLKDRRDFVIKEKRCFRCLRTGHGSKTCTNPHQCRKCKGKHPTALHDEDYTYNKTGNSITHRVLRGCESISATSLTMPVWISSSQNPGVERLVYALIDSQSDTTFVEESVARSLGIEMESTKLNVSTMTGEAKGVVCHRVVSLRVRGYQSHEHVHLPPTYTTDYIPMSNSVPTPNMVNKWAHLRKIATELPPKLNVEAGVLIGFDCSHAFLPRECITGADTEPFAIKTDLGWGVIGRAHSSIESKLNTPTSNRICAKEVPLTSLTDALRILDSDFRDAPDGKTVSQDDLKFLQIIQNTISKGSDTHYEMPLPFKEDQPPTLPNNKGHALKRLDHLKRKLEKDAELHTEYDKFTKAMVTDGHADRVKEPATDGREWYIPHHGVLHRHKKKLRIVFDCSAKTSNTLSLSLNHVNDSLLLILLYVTMVIISCGPITAIQVHQKDPTAPSPLTPNHILTMKPKTPLPPPGTFVKEDVYLRKRWRRVQYLVEQFWSRWKKEYLSNLTLRQKWTEKRRDLTVGDIVLISEASPRNQWPLARVITAKKGSDGLVRSVQLYVATKELKSNGQRSTQPTILERPVQRLVLLLAKEEQ